MSRSTVLVCSDFLYPPRGGGNLSIRTIALMLKGAGYEVVTAYVGDDTDPDLSGHPLRTSVPSVGYWPQTLLMSATWPSHLRRVIEEVRPAVVLCQQLVGLPTVATCKELGIPVVLFIRNLDYFCLGGFWAGKGRKCELKCIGCEDAGPRMMQWPFFAPAYRKVLRLIGSADAIVSNSDYVWRVLNEVWNIDSLTVFPMIEKPRVSETPSKRKILFFSPVVHKGSRVAVRIAKELPEVQFLFVGDPDADTRDAITSMENVEYVPWTSDIGPFYDQARLLIVPSLFPEAFGRACVEAMSVGVPCIVSSAGGLPDTIGEGGDVVRDYHNHSSWIEAIARYDDEDYYSEKSSRALSEYQRYVERCDKGKAALGELVGRLAAVH